MEEHGGVGPNRSSVPGCRHRPTNRHRRECREAGDGRPPWPRAAAGDHLESQVGQSLSEQALGSADQEDRFLQLPAAPASPPPCGCARCGGRGKPRGPPVAEAGRQHREIDVDDHPAVQAPEVVVEARPRLVGDLLEVHPFAVRQPKKRLVRARSPQRGTPTAAGVPRGHDLAFPPADVALGQRAAPGRTSSSRRGRRRTRPRRPVRSDPVAGLDLIEVARCAPRRASAQR